jgi:methionyl-tRNA formyltransferase
MAGLNKPEAVMKTYCEPPREWNLMDDGRGKHMPRIIVFGDGIGVPALLSHLPGDNVVAIVGASIRPQYHRELKQQADKCHTPFFIQERYSESGYEEFVKCIKEKKPDYFMVYSYSMKLHPDLLAVPSRGAINVHTSLLPKNRGPNSTQWAIIKGEAKTGVTLHYMNEEFDNGDIIGQKEVEIDFADTWVMVNEKILSKTDELLKEEIPRILQGKNSRKKQEHAKATKNKRLTPRFPRIDFETMNDRQIYNLIRAQVAPLKGAYLQIEKEKIFYNQYLKLEQVKALREKYGK